MDRQQRLAQRIKSTSVPACWNMPVEELAMFPAVDRVLGRELNTGFIDPCNDTAYFNFNLENIIDAPDDIDPEDFADLMVVECADEAARWQFLAGYDD